MSWTKTPPTRLGDWKWRIKEGAPEYVGSLFWDGGRLVFETAGFSEYVGLLNGEWSGPLVSVEEVERAYIEGYSECADACQGSKDLRFVKSQFEASRAHKIVQGEL